MAIRNKLCNKEHFGHSSLQYLDRLDFLDSFERNFMPIVPSDSGRNLVGSVRGMRSSLICMKQE